MTVPIPQQLGTVPPGGVFTPDGASWFIVTDAANDQVNLATGHTGTAFPPSQMVTYFPHASLSL